MIPQGMLETNFKIENNRMPSRTYRWNKKDNKIQGFTDGLKAIEQAIYKILSTERYEYLIYSFSYGVELEKLIGQDILYIQSDLKRRVQEALLQDDRIEKIDKFSLQRGTEKDCLLVSFEAITVSGVLHIESEVKI